MTKPLIATIAWTALGALLGACSNSTPSPQADNASIDPVAAMVAARSYAGSSSAFVQISPQELLRGNPSGACNVDKINGQVADDVPVDRMGMVVLDGWAADERSRTVPTEVRIVLQGVADFAVRARTGSKRPDVAAGRGIPALVDSGFKVNADMDGVPVGDYRVSVLIPTSNGLRLCDTHASVSAQ